MEQIHTGIVRVTAGSHEGDEEEEVEDDDDEFDELAEEFSNIVRPGDDNDKDESESLRSSGQSSPEPLKNPARPQSSRTSWSQSRQANNGVMYKTIATGERNERFLQETDHRADQVISDIYHPDLIRKTRPVSPVHPRIKRTPFESGLPMYVKKPQSASGQGICLVAKRAQVFSRPVTASSASLRSDEGSMTRLEGAFRNNRYFSGKSSSRAQSASLTKKRPSSSKGGKDDFLSVSGKKPF